MATKRTQSRLDAYERRYRDLARQLGEIGYIAAGSLAPRFNRCGKRTAPATPTTPAARALLAMDGKSRRQDHQPQAHPARSRALHRVDRQRPPSPRSAHPDARHRRRSNRTDP